jgi:hypothetical protein
MSATFWVPLHMHMAAARYVYIASTAMHVPVEANSYLGNADNVLVDEVLGRWVLQRTPSNS